jgi:hypothetical protein
MKNIESLIIKYSRERNSSQTRRRQIINGDILISTVNKIEKTTQSNSRTNGAWSNPINSKKSLSLEGTFNYDNMFKTNGFRETLKSTTL